MTLRLALLAITLLIPASGQRLAIIDVTIANGANTSSEVVLSDQPPLAIDMPAAFTGTHLKIEYSVDNGSTWKPVYTADNSLFLIPVGTSRGIPIAPSTDIAWLRRIRLVSTDNAGVAQNQASARTLKIIVRSLP